MIGKKLLKILQTLDPAAFRRLGEAFRSPLFTSSPLLLNLYELLKNEYPAFDESRLQKESVFQKLYPGKPFKDGSLRTLVREFTKITEDFLLFEALKNDKTARQQRLTQWYGEHNLFPEFEKGTQALLAQLDMEPYRDVEYFKDKAQLHFASYFHPNTEKHTLDDEALTRLMDSLDGYYILVKLRLASEMKNRERILSKQYELRLTDEILATGATDLLQDNAAFGLYRTLLELYETEKAPKAFQVLKKSLFEQIAQIRPFDQSMLLTQLINYAVRQLNSGQAEFNKEVFELYQLALSYNLGLSNGKIDASVYRNIASSGSREKAFEWTEKFIHEYAPFLAADIRQDSKTMALAMLCFHRQDYDGTIDLIAEHQFSDLLLQIHTRIMLLKAWFEKFLQDAGYYELLLYQINAAEKFIRRNAVISRQKKEENLNFILATRHLAEFMQNKKPASEIRSRLEKYLDGTQRVLSRGWLKSKIEQYQDMQ